jgi:RimJ/RimL family protein N-acetyltransferase
MSEPSLFVLETERLVLRRLVIEDAAFILELLTEPSWLRYIGDKGVRSLADAQTYLVNGPMASYDRFGFGLYCVELKVGGTPIGICGLIKRDSLPDADVGFALLPRFWGQGYATESAAAVLAYGRAALSLPRILAITTPDNHASIRVLETIGLRFERVITSETGSDLNLFTLPEINCGAGS